MRSSDQNTHNRRLGPTPGVRLVLCALCASLSALAIVCATAQALPARGRVLSGSFAGPGSAAGQLSQPAGVAIDEASGDVYVVDRANNRIERFGPHGEFVSTWGWGVSDGKPEFETCQTACQAGIAGDGPGQLHDPQAIAIDNSVNPSDPSRGDVYVVSDGRLEHAHLAKFTGAGEPLGALKQSGHEPKWEGALDGLAVDANGRLWVYRGLEAEGVVERFTDATPNKFEEPALETNVFCPKPGFAVSASGEAVYVDHERENLFGGCPGEEGETPRPVVAAALTSSGETLQLHRPALDPLQTDALAVNSSSGEVIADNIATVASFTAAGAPIQHLTLPGSEPAGSGLALNAATRTLYVADTAADTVDVFSREPPGKPTVSALAAQNLTPTSAQLSAQVDPTGADTHYYFQYGTEDCARTPEACTNVPAPPGNDIGEGFIDQPASVQLPGLKPATTYHYRLIAVNNYGQAEGSETFGSLTTLAAATGVLADERSWELVSPPNKDGSAIEPLRAEGGLIQSSQDGNAITYVANGPIVPEPEGNRAPYPTQALATRSAAGWSSQQIVTPRSTGEGFIPGEAPEYRFFSQDLSASLVQPDNQAQVEPFEQPPLSSEASEKTMYVRDSQTGTYLPLVTSANDTAGTRFGRELEFLSATPDLSHVVFYSEVPLTVGGEAGIYEWQAGQPLEQVSVLPGGAPALEPALGANSHNVRGAISGDGSRVFFTAESEIDNNGSGEFVRHLYMRDLQSDTTIQLDATQAPIPEPGEEESEVAFQAASSDGSKVFFTDTARLTQDSNLEPVPGSTTNPADLYECEIILRDGKPACQLTDLTVEQNGGESAGVLDIVPGVSEDGSYVYFIANGVLAPGAEPGHCVRVNIEQPPPGATCNLYMWHQGTIGLVATLSDEDAPDWGRSEAIIKGGESSIEPLQDLSDVTARVSPDGRYLAFMSNRSLTGYDNVDSNPAAKGARDEEVYLYDAAAKLLLCASCNPNGRPPQGVFDTEKAGEGLGLLVDRRADWAYKPKTPAPTAHWLAASIPGWTPLSISSAAQALRQPRYLTDTGRLFFDSADPLVPVQGAQTRTEVVNGEATQVGIENVYEHEPAGNGSCAAQEGCTGLISSGTSPQESAFLDASENGNDAFFLTAQPLVAADRDTNFDLYDARVCTVESPCLTSESASPRPCETTDSCRSVTPGGEAPLAPAGTATASAQPPASSPTPTPQHPVAKPPAKPATRAEKLAKALRRCRARYQHSHMRRVRCERQARRTYAAKKTSHAAKKKGK